MAINLGPSRRSSKSHYVIGLDKMVKSLLVNLADISASKNYLNLHI